MIAMIRTTGIGRIYRAAILKMRMVKPLLVGAPAIANAVMRTPYTAARVGRVSLESAAAGPRSDQSSKHGSAGRLRQS
jgi:hypothetical protein